MESYSTLMLANRWRWYKAVFGVLGAVASPTALFIAYHTAQLSLSNVNLNIINLEKQKQSYIEYIEPAEFVTRAGSIIGNDNYINGPVWRKIGARRGPKYWAKIARTCGPLPRAFAIEILSRLHDLPDGVFYSMSLSCDDRTLIELARKPRTDTRFFRPPRRCYDETEYLSTQLYRFLRRLPSDIDPCAKYYADILLGRASAIPESPDDSGEDDDIAFISELHKPRKPPPQSLASLTQASLDVIWHDTMGADRRTGFIYQEEGLQLLTRIWYVFSSDEAMMCKLASILVNLTQDPANHTLLASGGFLHMLALWMKSLNRELQCKAASALANFSDMSSHYQSGMYLLHPVHKHACAPEVDVVFIHGVGGAAFHTWRQHPMMKAESEDYSSCWPIDWLGEEFGATIRAVGADYVSNATYWDSRCPYSVDKLTIDEQARCLAGKLADCKIGEGRKIVWIGHSLGGLIIKRLLTLASEEEEYGNLLSSTRDIIFTGVPHRGCPVAQLTHLTSYITSPSVQLQEIADTAKLSALNQKFIALVNEQHINCKNFMEGAKTQTTANIKLHLVPPEYAELEVGENILLEEENHITICKPRDRNSMLFKTLEEMLLTLVNEQTLLNSECKTAPVKVFDSPLF